MAVIHFQDFITGNTLVEALCLIASVLCFRRHQKKVWRVFPIYLLAMCFTELYGIFLRKNHHNNQWPYNFLILFDAIFINLVFAQLFKYYFKSSRITLIGLAVLLIVYLFEVQNHGFALIFDTRNDLLNNITNNVMSVIFTLYALIYFYMLLKDERYIDLKYSADFWWVTGVLFFYFGSIIIKLFRGLSHSELPYQIITVLIWIIYGCWIYSFICRRWLTMTLDS